jgi:hypothetical protein
MPGRVHEVGPRSTVTIEAFAGRAVTAALSVGARHDTTYRRTTCPEMTMVSTRRSCQGRSPVAAFANHPDVLAPAGVVRTPSSRERSCPRCPADRCRVISCLRDTQDRRRLPFPSRPRIRVARGGLSVLWTGPAASSDARRVAPRFRRDSRGGNWKIARSPFFELSDLFHKGPRLRSYCEVVRAGASRFMRSPDDEVQTASIARSRPFSHLTA